MIPLTTLLSQILKTLHVCYGTLINHLNIQNKSKYFLFLSCCQWIETFFWKFLNLLPVMYFSKEKLRAQNSSSGLLTSTLPSFGHDTISQNKMGFSVTCIIIIVLPNEHQNKLQIRWKLTILLRVVGVPSLIFQPLADLQ